MNTFVDPGRIMEHMEVVDRNGRPIGVVDHLEGDRIKLTKDDSPDGRHHIIPVSLVESVDQKVHLNQTRDSVVEHWGSV